MKFAADTTPAPVLPSGCGQRLREPGRPSQQAAAGFTLLELMCVLALLALLIGLVLPSMYRTIKREQTRATLRELAVALRTARSVAATSHRRVRFFVDLKTGRYRLEGSAQQRALVGMRLDEARLVWQTPEKRQGYIAFYADGSSSGGFLALKDPAGKRHFLEVEIITGKVTLRTEGG